MPTKKDTIVASPSSLESPVPGGQEQEDASKIIGSVTLGPTEVKKQSAEQTQSSSVGDVMAQPSQESVPGGQDISPPETEQSFQTEPSSISAAATIGAERIPSSKVISSLKELEQLDSLEHSDLSTIPPPQQMTKDEKLGWWQNITNRFFSSFNKTPEGGAKTLLGQLQKQGNPEAEVKVESGDIFYKKNPASNWEEFDPGPNILKNLANVFKNRLGMGDRDEAAGAIKDAVKKSYIDGSLGGMVLEAGSLLLDPNVHTALNDVYKGTELADAVDIAGDIVQYTPQQIIEKIGVSSPFPGTGVTGYVGGAVVGRGARQLVGSMLGVPMEEWNVLREGMSDAGLSFAGNFLFKAAKMTGLLGKMTISDKLSGSSEKAYKYFQDGTAIDDTLSRHLSNGSEAAIENFVETTRDYFTKFKPFSEEKRLQLLALLTDHVSAVRATKALPYEEVGEAFSDAESGYIQKKARNVWKQISTLRNMVAKDAEKKGAVFEAEQTQIEILKIAEEEGWLPDSTGLFNAASRIKNKSRIEVESAEKGIQVTSQKEEVERFSKEVIRPKYTSKDMPGPDVVFRDLNGISDLQEIMNLHDTLVMANRDGKKLDFSHFVDQVIPAYSKKAGYGKRSPVFDESGRAILSPELSKSIPAAEVAYKRIREQMKADSVAFIGDVSGKQWISVAKKQLQEYSNAATFGKLYGYLFTKDGGYSYAEHLMNKKNLPAYKEIVNYFGKDSEEVAMIKGAIADKFFDKMTDDGTKFFNTASFKEYYAKNDTMIKQIFSKEERAALYRVQSAAERNLGDAAGKFSEKSTEDMFNAIVNLQRVGTSRFSIAARTARNTAKVLYNATRSEVMRADFVANELFPKYLSMAKNSKEISSLLKTQGFFIDLMENSTVVKNPKGGRMLIPTKVAFSIMYPKEQENSNITSNQVAEGQQEQDIAELEKITKTQE